MDDCVFCKMIEEKIDREIARLPNSLVVLDRDQTYKGKTLVILNRHCEDLSQISEEERNGMFSDMNKVSEAVKSATDADRMNYAMLGNGVPHLHFHVFPRFEGDKNWGDAPWPSDDKRLSDEEYMELVSKIKEKIE